MARGGKRPGAGRKANRVKAEQAKTAPPQHPEPQAYDPVIVEQARKLSELGATDVELADFFGISVATIYRWKIEFIEFSEATKAGKSAADDRVERSLYLRAVGYTYEATKIFMPAGAKAPVYAPYREHVPPDTAAATMWLKNRRKDDWRDKQEHELTGKNGGPIEVTKIERVIVRPADPDS